MVKVGITASKKKSISVDNKLTKDFISVVDGITFGILEGNTIHTVTNSWGKENKLRWAKANTAFFRLLANNLEKWGDAVAKEKD